MSEQSLDLKAAWTVLRRHAFLLTVALLVGAVAGVALAVWRPPLWTSESTVLLPPASESGVGAAERDSGTQVRVASSDLVLGQAGRESHTRRTRRQQPARRRPRTSWATRWER